VALLADATVVVPTRRLAHSLKTSHDLACLDAGLEVWRTPDIVSFDDLVERMFHLDRQHGRLARRWLPASASRLMWERLVADDPALAGLLAPGTVGKAALQSWRQLHRWDIPLSAIDEDPSPESIVFAKWARVHAEWLQSFGWLDEALAPAVVSAESAPRSLRLVGFQRLTPQQQAFFGRLERGGVQVTQEARRSSQGRAGWIACEHAAAEIEAAGRWAASRLHGRERVRLAIVIPDLAPRRDQIRRTLDRVLAPETGVSGKAGPGTKAYELAAAKSLSRAPVVAAALELLGVIIRHDGRTAASALLRTRYCRAAEEEASARAKLDAWIRNHEGPDLTLGRLQALCQRRGCPRLAEAIRSALEAWQTWPKRALSSEWSRRVFDLLGRLGWPGDGVDSPGHQARMRWQGLLAEFGACDDLLGRVGPDQALAELRGLTESAMFEPESVAAPLLVIDPETSVGMSFDAIWVCGMESSRWPPPAAPDPFLPRAWQVRRGMPSASAALAEADAKQRLEGLIASADEVIFSAPQFDGEAALLPSSLLAGLPELQPDAAASWPVPALARISFDAKPVQETVRDTAMPPLSDGEAARGGARILELVSACPFRAHAEQRLGAKPLEDPELGLAATERGDLVHVALAELWAGIRDQSRLLELDSEQVRMAIDDAIASAIARLALPAEGLSGHLLRLEARWLAQRLAELLDEDRQRTPFTVELREQEQQFVLQGLTLRLRPDRVDRLADGTLVVIDYKTGATADPRSWMDERPQLPQLPLYVEALGNAQVSAVAFGRVRTGSTGYVGLTRAEECFPGLGLVGARGPAREFASWEQMLAEWRRRLEALAGEYVRGDARLAPDPVNACRYCHLTGLCRVEETSVAMHDGETEASVP
jgi:probable DNA repair protein